MPLHLRRDNYLESAPEGALPPRSVWGRLIEGAVLSAKWHRMDRPYRAWRIETFVLALLGHAS